MNNYLKVLSFFGLLLFACNSTNRNTTEKEDVLLATVYNRSLFLSQIEEMIPSSASKEDSTLFLNSYVERWVRECLLMHEAEVNIPKDLNIDQLVRDYRASLIQHNYEQILIELELDSIITSAELIEFYEKNKNQYQLERPIVRCHFIKIPLAAPDQELFSQWWKSQKKDDFVKLIDYCNRFADIHMLKDSTWYKLDDIFFELPQGAIEANNFNSRKELVVDDGTHKYFYRRFEFISKDNIAPLAFVEDQASKAILHKRKLKLLEQKKEEMYERELGKNNVKIYKK